ncbi:MAG: lecithin retinol acyltransferase family protein [Sulfurimonas sp.]|uniref:lecithin retinol acyltransferase family protein n=1 Tax=Sulfurimonas sp. TaxID=2022749 RepID=UPI00356767D9
MRRNLYTHHGLQFGCRVIHFTGTPFRKGVVEIISLESFAGHGTVRVVSEITDDGSILRKALSRIGDTDYSVVFNNCEHFVHWCMTGRKKSAQVRNGISAAAVITACTGWLLYKRWRRDFE